MTAYAVENREPERARAGAVLDQREGTRAAELDPHLLDPPGEGPAEDGVGLGRGQEVAGIGGTVGGLAVVAEVGLVQGTFHVSSETDAAARARLDLGANPRGEFVGPVDRRTV